MYTKIELESTLILILYVDDLLIVSNNITAIIKLKKDLKAYFEMSAFGKLTHFLGIDIKTDKESLYLSQEGSIEKLLKKFGMSECNSVKSPMEKGLKSLPSTPGEETKQPYREPLGSLMYIMLCTRPDICFPVAYMGRYQQNPSDLHWQNLKVHKRY